MNEEPNACAQKVCVENEYFTQRINDGYLVTARHGGFVFLDAGEYTALWHGTFRENDALLKKLMHAGIVLSEKNISDVVRSLEKQFLFFLAPKSYILNMSDECNLACIYCHANSVNHHGRTMSTEVMEQARKFIFSSPSSELCLEFQGGEPLAKFGMIKEFVEKVKRGADAAGKKISSIVIVTNMTLMTEEIAKYILDNNIGICSSLDGPQELHDMHRRYAAGTGSYRTVTKWISYFREHKKTINLLPTITACSIDFGAKSIIDEYLKWGCDRIMLRPVFHIGRAKDKKNIHLLPEQFVNFWKEGADYMVSLGGQKICDPVLQAMLRNVMGFPRSFMCMRMPCGAGISQLSISPDGSIFPCDLAKTMPGITLGNINENYFDILARMLPMMTRTCEAQPLCDTCAFNAYCGSCFARTFAAFSDTVSRIPHDFDCKVNKAMFTYLFEKMQDETYRKIFDAWAKQKR